MAGFARIDPSPPTRSSRDAPARSEAPRRRDPAGQRPAPPVQRRHQDQPSGRVARPAGPDRHQEGLRPRPIQKACDAIRTRLFRAAVTANDSPLAGLDPDSLDLRDGMVIAGTSAAVRTGEALVPHGSGVVQELAAFIPEGAAATAAARRSEEHTSELP